MDNNGKPGKTIGEADYDDAKVAAAVADPRRATTNSNTFSSSSSKNQSKRMPNGPLTGSIPAHIAAMRERRKLNHNEEVKMIDGRVSGGRGSQISNSTSQNHPSNITTTNSQPTATRVYSPPHPIKKGLQRRLIVRPPTNAPSRVVLPRKAGLRRPPPRTLLANSSSSSEEEEQQHHQDLLLNRSSSVEEKQEEEEEELHLDEENQPERRRSTLAVEAILVEDTDDDEEDRQRIEEEIRNRILQEAVIGEAIHIQATMTTEDEKNPLLMMGEDPEKRKRIVFGCAALVFVATLGVVLSLYLTWKRDNQNTETPLSAELIHSTSSPTISNEPSLTPAVSIINQQSRSPTATTNEPSFLPSVSTQPTSFPTISNENRNNTKREEAKFLELRSPPLEANISSFAQQWVATACLTGRQQQSNTRGLSYAESLELKGLWYTYTPKVLGPVSVISCGGRVQLQVFESKFQCFSDPHLSGLGVFAPNGDMGSCGGTSFSWEAIEGRTYDIFLYLEEDDDTEDNNPQISLSENKNKNNNIVEQESNIFLQPKQLDDDIITIQVVDNDLCQYAFGPVTPTSAGVVLSYNTLEATVDDGDKVLQVSCGGASAPASPGVWYAVKGTGHPITASTCTYDQMLSIFDTQISVFRGDDCQSLVCVNGNNDACGQLSSVTWPSKSEEIYYVLVHGPSSDHNNTQAASIAGRYQLTISTDFDRLENDLCGSAEEIPQGYLAEYNGTDDCYVCGFVPGSVVGAVSFAGSTADQDIPCLKSESIPYGIWYFFKGTGDPFYVGHYVGQSVRANEDMGVIVFSGACGQLSCAETITKSGPGPFGTTFEVCFPTIVNATYYIYVYTTLPNALKLQHQLGLGTCSLDDWM